MRKLLLILLISFFFGSCTKTETKINTTPKSETLTDQQLQAEAQRITDSAVNAIDKQVSEGSILEKPESKELLIAKNLVDESTSWVKKGILKEVSVKEVNDNINPIMGKVQEINLKLSSKEKEELERYRQMQNSELIDLQVQNN